MSQPNFVVFLTDDQGYGDLSCMGAPDFRTPHLDRLARDGTRFTNWYSNSPVCSPARASLLTGRYPGNAGVRSILGGHRYCSGLLDDVTALPVALKKLGYQTYMSGKWHLGVTEPCRPHNHGFDRWYGFLAGCIDYYSHIFYWGMNMGGPGQNPTHDLWEDNQPIWQDGEYFTEAITGKAVDYLRAAAHREEPFFLYVAYNAPHYPMHAPQKYKDRFPDLPWDRQIMAAMLSAVDDGVGEIMAELERLGMADNTVTVFTADNGPSRESRNWLDGTLDPYYGGTTGGLKGHKFSLYEGGIRVPGILHGPGHIPGGQVMDRPVASMDVFPTLVGLAGGDPTDYDVDGVDILPWVAGGRALPEREIYWEMADQTAVRRGPWKLVLNGRLVEHEEPPCEVHLANLAEDMGETTNLAEAEPDLCAELKLRAERWRAGIEDSWQNVWEPRRQAITAHHP